MSSMDTPTAAPAESTMTVTIPPEAPTTTTAAPAGPSLLSRMLAGGVSVMEPSAPVPDVLLSLAKDDRYISEVASLLAQVIVPFASIFFVPRRRASASASRQNTQGNDYYDGQEIVEDDGQQFIDRIKPEINLLASMLVHSATFVFYTRHFGTRSGAKGPLDKSSINPAAKRSLGMESLNLAYQYPRKRNTQQNNIRTNNEKLANDKSMKHNSLSRSSTQSFRWHYLIFLQTIVPYFIQRAGRGGWSTDLGSLLSTILQQLGFRRQRASLSGSTMTTNGNGSNQQINTHTDGDEREFRNDDRLRGVARRRLFEEQRRRMMSSASTAGDSAANDHSNGNSAARLENDASESSLSLARDTTATNQTTYARVWNCISGLSWKFMQKVSLATSSMSHGAHTLPGHVTAPSAGFDHYTKIIKWFLRLHLALFYWNGAYPTIAHRLAGARIRDNVPPPSTNPSSGNIIANRPSYKPIAGLILVQAAAGLAHTMGELSIEAAHLIQVAFFRWRRRVRMQQQISEYGAANGNNVPADSERAEYLELIEERVPGISSADKYSRQSTKQRRPKKKDTGAHPCGICLNERVNPAAPSVCGHVFCWNCILHWVSNVRAECPLCRAKTRPQDVIPLYNYP